MQPTVILFLLALALIGFTGTKFIRYASNETDHKPQDEYRRAEDSTDAPEATSIFGYNRQQLLLGPALNVTVREGDKALMPCIAPHLGVVDSTVYAGHTYFFKSCLHQISTVRASDEGFYQCQVNTEPKQSRTVVLIVLEQNLKDSPIVSAEQLTNVSGGPGPRLWNTLTLKVGGFRHRSVVEGDTAALVCSATSQAKGLDVRNIELAWWRGDVKLTYTDPEKRIGTTQIVGNNHVTAELEITAARLNDTGKYHCRVASKHSQYQLGANPILKETWITLHVVKEPAPFITNQSIPGTSLKQTGSLVITCAIFMKMMM